MQLRKFADPAGKTWIKFLKPNKMEELTVNFTSSLKNEREKLSKF